MQKKIVIDTNIYIEIFNFGLHEHLNRPFRYIVYLAHPVLHELWAGANGKKEIRFLHIFQDNFVRKKRLIVPTVASLIFTGQVCHQLRKNGRLDPAYPKHYNDIAIAILARQVGAAVITKNIKDFKTIRKIVDFDFLEPETLLYV